MADSLKQSCYELHKTLSRILQVPLMYGADVKPENKAALEGFIAELKKLNSNPARMMNASAHDRDCTYVKVVARRVAEWKDRFPDDDNGLIGSLSQALDDVIEKQLPPRRESHETVRISVPTHLVPQPAR
jgi:hypothetical protein